MHNSDVHADEIKRIDRRDGIKGKKTTNRYAIRIRMGRELMTISTESTNNLNDHDLHFSNYDDGQIWSSVHAFYS